jgi:hypothetical protein
MFPDHINAAVELNAKMAERFGETNHRCGAASVVMATEAARMVARSRCSR